ncbi:multidrug effflux MFS transporter [Thiotrichales bacterium 19S9-12]|nr:multidrug effflux MFS transporter [Thiotrichales bacterium 19S9-11]MCF6810863.1 multidrug effflux MFS transporter [Thiotrichales bacterium 19S9-12]
MGKGYKLNIIILTTIMAGFTQAGLVLYTPAFLDMSQSLNISSSLIKTTLTGYLFGFGISQLIYGPLSDRSGRKNLLLIGMFIFSLGCLWSIFSSSYLSLLLSRVLQGIGAGSCMTLSRTILRDSFSGKEYFKVASYLSSGFAVGLGITPVIGGHLLDYFPWQSEFIFLFICGVSLLLAFWKFLPETHQVSKDQVPFSIFVKTIFTHFSHILKNKYFNLYLLGGVAAYGVVIAYSTMAPFLIQKTLGFSASFYGWLTLFIAIAYYLGTLTSRKLVMKLGHKIIIQAGVILILLSGIFLIISGAVFGFFNIYVVMIPLLIATYGQALIWSNCIAGALNDLPHIAGTASSLFSCLQMILATILSGIIAIPHEKNQIPISLVVLILGVITWIIFNLGVFKKSKT